MADETPSWVTKKDSAPSWVTSDKKMRHLSRLLLTLKKSIQQEI